MRKVSASILSRKGMAILHWTPFIVRVNKKGVAMPRGEHFYTCLGCGVRDTCGDCIRTFCPECERKNRELQEAGWRSCGLFGGEYFPPGAKSYLLTDAYEAHQKGEA